MSPLRDLQEELDETSKLLLAPVLAHPEQATPHLEHAAEALGRLKQHLLAEATDLSPAKLAELKRDLRDVTALAGQAGGFYLGCAVILESLTRVYTPGGTVGALSGRPSLSLEG